MKNNILALLLTLAPALANAETFSQPVMIQGDLARAVWTSLGPMMREIPEGARVKQALATCLRTSEREKAHITCQAVGSAISLNGAAAETLFQAMPARRQMLDVYGRVYRTTTVTCTESGESTPYVYLCAIPQ